MMETKTSAGYLTLDGIADDDFYAQDSLDALEVEDLLGRHVEFDEQDDWQTIEF
jgi:hypothetical protein